MGEYRRREREKNILSGVNQIKNQTAVKSGESEDDVKKAWHDIVSPIDDKTSGAVQHFFKSFKKHPTICFPIFKTRSNSTSMVKLSARRRIGRPRNGRLFDEKT